MFLSTSSQVDVIINSNDAVILNCSLRGYPLSDLHWRKDDSPLYPDGSHITITTFRRQDPTDPYPFSSNMDSNFESIPLEGLEYFEAVSELTLVPPLLRNDTANYTCEVVAVFVQNFTVTSDNIPVFILGESQCWKGWSFWLNSLWCILTNITISPFCVFLLVPSSLHLPPSNQFLLAPSVCSCYMVLYMCQYM